MRHVNKRFTITFRPRVPAAKKDGQRNDVDTPATSFPCARFIPANSHGYNCFKHCYTTIHRVSIKRPPPLTCYNLDIHGSITIIFGTSVTEKVGSQTILYFPTSPNLRFCTTWGNRKPENCTFSLNCCMLFTKNTKYTW